MRAKLRVLLAVYLAAIYDLRDVAFNAAAGLMALTTLAVIRAVTGGAPRAEALP